MRQSEWASDSFTYYQTMTHKNRDTVKPGSKNMICTQLKLHLLSSSQFLELRLFVQKAENLNGTSPTPLPWSQEISTTLIIWQVLTVPKVYPWSGQLIWCSPFQCYFHCLDRDSAFANDSNLSLQEWKPLKTNLYLHKWVSPAWTHSIFWS